MECWSNGVIILNTPLLRKLPLRLQRLLYFGKRQAIHHVLPGEPAFAGDADSEPQILKALGPMSIGIDHAFDAFLFG